MVCRGPAIILRSRRKRLKILSEGESTFANVLYRFACMALCILQDCNSGLQWWQLRPSSSNLSAKTDAIYLLSTSNVTVTTTSNLNVICDVAHLSQPGAETYGDWGDGPLQNLRWGDGSPIFWEVVLSDTRESTNRVIKGVIKKLFSEVVVFLVRKGSYTTFYIVKIRKIWENPKNLVDD